MTQPQVTQLISRKDALAHGITHYFTGVPCVHGHLDKRYARDGQCMSCARVKLQKRYADNPEKEKARSRDQTKRLTNEGRAKRAERAREARIKNPERFKEYDRRKYCSIRANPEKLAIEQDRQREKQKRAYVANPEKFKTRRLAYHSKNREMCNEKAREWKRQNPEKVKALNDKWGSLSRALRKQRVPKWLSDQDLADIRNIYKKARAAGLHVDHIIPLQGKLVSGLHVPSNLQLLTCSENAAKRNRYEVL